MSLKTRGWYVQCDARNCDSQFDPGDDITDPNDAGTAAVEAGWSEITTTIKGASETRHYCPKVHRIVRTRTTAAKTQPAPSSEPE